MLRREVAVSRADVRLLTGNVSKLGGYALGLLDLFELGIDREAVQAHLRRTKEQLGTISAEGPYPIHLRPQAYADRALLEATDLPWNYPQTLRFASGACMISQKYYRWMSEGNLKRAMMAKVLHKCQLGILDDVIDKGGYSYLEAKDLYHLVLSSMTAPSLNMNALRRRIMTNLRQDQVELFDVIVAMASHFNALFSAAPYRKDLFYEMEKLDERVALGQALTMFQKEPTLELGQIASIARSFYAPDDSIPWYERLAGYIGNGTQYNLIDISFLDRKLKESRFKRLLEGWYFFDIVVVFLNNIVNVYQDLREGIVNLSLIAMREKDVLSLTSTKGYEPELTLDDYKDHLVHLAGIAARGLETLGGAFHDTQQYYPFIALMMPVVMMADWIGNSDEMIHAYVEALAPDIRRQAEKFPGRAKAKDSPAALLVSAKAP